MMETGDFCCDRKVSDDESFETRLEIFVIARIEKEQCNVIKPSRPYIACDLLGAPPTKKRESKVH
jgi:hypothetical protein